MDRFDIQTLRALPIEGVAQRLGLQVSRHKSFCPFHDDSHPSLTFSTGRNTYKCFVCDSHGGVISLAMRMLGKPFPETCQWLADEHNVILTRWKPADRPAVPKPFDAARFSRFFEHPFLSEPARHFLFGERKLHPRVVSWCRLTSFTDRQGIPWLQIPYYDIQGRLIGVQNRNLGYHKPPSPASSSSLPSSLSSSLPPPAPRFRFPAGSRCCIYNLPVLQLLREGEPLYITEGASDCWAMLSSGHKAIAIPSATLLNPRDIELIRSRLIARNTILHMYPDNDEPGEKLYHQLVALANRMGMCIVRHTLPAGCKDYSDFYGSNCQASAD